VTLGAGLLGTSLTGAVYVLLGSRLPGSVPVYAGSGGTAIGSVPTEAFLVVGIALNLALTAVFTLVVRRLSDSHVLEEYYGQILWWALVGGGASVTLGSIPVAWIAKFVMAAGEWPSGWPSFVEIILAVVFVPILLFVGAPLTVLGLRGRDNAPGSRPKLTAGGTRLGLFQCSSCGKTFLYARVPLRAPQLGVRGVPGRASYYLRCPRCGERGWNLFLGFTERPTLNEERMARRGPGS
jgi:DNA-directed RNA polymerase subunit RPC12/RpoP/uncharacterized membrane protein YhaH (DUF805 family)